MDFANHERSRLAPLALACSLALLAGCATTPRQANHARTEMPRLADDWSASQRALSAGDWSDARQSLARLLQQDLRNGHLQFLHALAEENEARGSDRARLELASVGYANAVRFAPGQYWALLHLGFLELERDEFAAAQARFAEAAMDQPDRWEAFYGLGVASYFGRDLPMLSLAAARAHELAPDAPEAQRLQALSLAAQGDPAARDLARRTGADGGPAGRAHLERRVGEFLAVADVSPAGFEDGGQFVPSTQPLEDPSFKEAPNQVVVEVTILLSSKLDQSTRGVNLFDGLRMLYGYSNTLAQTINSLGRESTRSITSQISTPQLDYSLNLFNDSGQHYSVVARPSITAHLGRESQFFAGRTINVEVSGVNLGQLQPIDVGVQLKVTPEQIDGRKVTFQVSAERSFLSQEQVGTFERSLATFRQTVSATADVEFGQTLVLSALSEEVSDRFSSKVPVAGDIPLVGLLAKRTSDTTRQESLLILVTPKLPLTIATPDTPAKRQQAAEALLATWNERVDPRADVPSILKRLQRTRWLRQPEAGDLGLTMPRPEKLQREAIEETLALARR